MHKVFVNDYPLWFAEIYGREKKFPPSMEIISNEKVNVEELITMLENNESGGIVYLSSNPEESWKEFISFHTLMEAGGGVVRNPQGSILFIFRKGKWDLPKGKKEYDESIGQTAVREVKEECGLKNVELNELILKTFHTYTAKKKRVLKKTSWYEMECGADEKLIPQTEEDITKIEWFTAAEIRDVVMRNTYASIAEVLRGTRGVGRGEEPGESV